MSVSGAGAAFKCHVLRMLCNVRALNRPALLLASQMPPPAPQAAPDYASQSCTNMPRSHFSASKVHGKHAPHL